MNHFHISKSISKLGKNIPSLNLPPVVTCRKDAPCVSKCYARKGRFGLPHNAELLKGNYEFYKTDPFRFQNRILDAACGSEFFRWHSAGDIPDMAYFSMMIEIAKELPETKFLAFTKQFETVNARLASDFDLPANLTIVFSNWEGFTPSNPFNLPTAHIMLKHGDNSRIPTEAMECPKYCGSCVMSGCSCWHMRCGESVFFHEH